jgi:ankyrin repeat protein
LDAFCDRCAETGESGLREQIQKQTQNCSDHNQLLIPAFHPTGEYMIKEQGMTTRTVRAAIPAQRDYSGVERAGRAFSSRGFDKDGKTALGVACVNGDLERVCELLWDGRPVNERNYFGATALMEACIHGHAKIVRVLSAHGADPNIPEGLMGVCPLMAASLAGDADIAQELLEHGANPHAEDATGRTALYEACLGGAVAIVRMLLARGVSVDAQGHSGAVPIIAAAISGSVECLDLLLRHGARVDAVNKEGRTALMEAAMNGSRHAVLLLLRHAADRTIRDRKGRTALMWAVTSGKMAAAAVLTREEQGYCPIDLEDDTAA